MYGCIQNKEALISVKDCTYKQSFINSMDKVQTLINENISRYGKPLVISFEDCAVYVDESGSAYCYYDEESVKLAKSIAASKINPNRQERRHSNKNWDETRWKRRRDKFF